MAACLSCGYANAPAAQFCANPRCRAYLGASGVRSENAPPGPSSVVAADSSAPPYSPPEQRRGAKITIAPAALSVLPGSLVTATLAVRNLGTRVEEFRLTPMGPGAAFATVAPASLSVYPDDEGQAVLTFAPVLGTHSLVGAAEFEVVARSTIHADVVDVARGVVTVAIQLRPGQPERGVQATLAPTDLSVEPGGAATASLTVRNLGVAQEDLRVELRGLAAMFATVSPPALTIYPEAVESVGVRFAPVRSPAVAAGRTPYEILIWSPNQPGVHEVATGTVQISPFVQLHAVLRPGSARRAGQSIDVSNMGNAPVDVDVQYRDDAGVLSFAPGGWTGTLQPGTTGNYPTRVRGPRRWFGRTKRYPFTSVVNFGTVHPPITVRALRVQPPIIPWWVRLVVLVRHTRSGMRPCPITDTAGSQPWPRGSASFG